MRRSLALITSIVVLLVLLPGAALAAPSTRTHEDAVVLSCEIETGDGFVSMFAVVSSEFGSFGDVAYWQAPADPMQDPPTLVTTSSQVTGDASGMTGTFDLATFDITQEPPIGDPAGTAVLAATFTPEGDVIEVDERFRNGNRWERVEGTVQLLAVEGSLTLPGDMVVDLGGMCFAADQDLDLFMTNPAAFNDRFQHLIVSCTWESEEQVVQFSAIRDAFGAFGDVFVGTMDSAIGGGGDALLTETDLTFETTMVDFETEVPVGTAAAAATLTATGERVRSRDVFFNDQIKVRAELYAIDGSLDVTIDGTTTTYPMDAEHCYAAEQNVFVHHLDPAGPKGKPLANDTPEGATPLPIGRTVRAVTGGNAFEPEAPCMFTAPGEPDPIGVPITYTAWWTVTGTGGPLTVDTAGSQFDTVVGVYVMGDLGFEQVVCVDDVAGENGLLAVATWASEAGVTYYIQVGGFGGSAGRLVVSVE